MSLSTQEKRYADAMETADSTWGVTPFGGTAVAQAALDKGPGGFRDLAHWQPSAEFLDFLAGRAVGLHHLFMLDLIGVPNPTPDKVKAVTVPILRASGLDVIAAATDQRDVLIENAPLGFVRPGHHAYERTLAALGDVADYEDARRFVNSTHGHLNSYKAVPLQNSHRMALTGRGQIAPEYAGRDVNGIREAVQMHIAELLADGFVRDGLARDSRAVAMIGTLKLRPFAPGLLPE